MKKLAFCLILAIITSTTYGQQAVQHSLYMFNQHNFNPAYAGLDESISIVGDFRKQWVGLLGSPATQNLNVHTPVVFLGSGIGLRLENDVIGAEQNITATASYAFHREIGEGVLSFGANGGIVQKTLDGTILEAPDQDQPDQYIPLGIETSSAPTLGVGAYFKNERMELGVSANNLLESTFLYGEGESSGIQLKRNYFFIFAYRFGLSSSIDIQPSIFAKSDFVETQVDLSALAYYNDNIFLGASFRGYSENTFDAVVIIGGMKINKNLTVAYSYDLSLFELSGFNDGSHEIILRYQLDQVIGKPKPAKVIYNPRLLTQ